MEKIENAKIKIQRWRQALQDIADLQNHPVDALIARKALAGQECKREDIINAISEYARGEVSS